MSGNTNIHERLAFMQLDQDSQSALRELAPLIVPRLPAVLRGFYEHVGKWPQVSRFFGSEDAIRHASQKQIDHWSIILRGDFNESYVNSVRKIGQTHSRIGLEPRWYIAGYKFIIARVVSAIAAHCHDPQTKLRDLRARAALTDRFVNAFTSAALLDMDFAISIYLEESERAKQKALHDLAQTFESSVGSIVQTVASAATELENTARSMSSIAESTTGKAIAVSAAAEQATSNVSHVAGSAEELGRAVTEIAQQIGHASRVAADGVVKARTTVETMSQLTRAADMIGEVVSLISDIAGQTNLLALNATIESARAGEAGRGFAVVAAEVKALAGQTSKATGDISAQISGIQSVVRDSVNAIAAIQKTINEINDVSVSINAAVEEQSASTREIARNTQEAAAGTQDVTRNITEVQRDAADAGAAASEVVAAAADLGRTAEQLRVQVEQFIGSIRAA